MVKQKKKLRKNDTVEKWDEMHWNLIFKTSRYKAELYTYFTLQQALSSVEHSIIPTKAQWKILIRSQCHYDKNSLAEHTVLPTLKLVLALVLFPCHNGSAAISTSVTIIPSLDRRWSCCGGVWSSRVSQLWSSLPCLNSALIYLALPNPSLH